MSNKSGIGSNVISLPKGGGAQNGMGEKFSPDLFTGTGNFSVPIAVPAGRNGFQPQLNLGYSTGNGNSPFGMGWGISVPGIMRKTNKGIPVYDDNRDVFILSGAEDLVLIGDETVSEGAHRKMHYRPRTEGLFARITHHTKSSGENYWEVKSKDGLTSFYGRDVSIASDQYQLTNPADESQVFAWKLWKTEDPFGNVILYDYDKVRVDDAEHFAVQHYLKEIKYLNYDDGGNAKFLCSVQFTYEDRPDAYSEGRAGFEVRTTKRCSQIETFTHPKDADLPSGYTADPSGNEVLVKRYELSYQAELPLNGTSLLESVQVFGFDANSSETESMPALKFGYSEFDPTSRDFFPLQGKGLPYQSLAAPELELADLDGNGLPDFIEMNGQTVRFWKNQGNGAFAMPQLMKEAPAFSLADPQVQLMDADGDGRIDLVVSKPAQNGYFPLNHRGEWDSKGMQRYKVAPSFSFSDPEIKMLDLDGDGITDIMRGGSRFEYFYQDSYANGSLKAQGWKEVRTANRQTLDAFPNVNLSNPKIKLADMNGDGLQDVVQVENGSIFYWPNLGHGKWGKRRVMKGGNGLKFPQQWDPRQVILGDVVGDGQADLIYVDNGEVHLWINQSGNRWSERIRIKGTPAVYNPDAVRLVDLLGQGVSGLLFTYNQGEGGMANQRAYFLDFTSGTKPYVMNQMDNQMGAVTKVSYESSIQSWIKDHALGTSTTVEKRPWKTTLPFPVQVVAKTEAIDQLSKGKLVTEYQYSHGYWDGYEREFRGFGRVEQRDTETFQRYNENSANNFNAVDAVHYSPPTKTVNWFHLGGVNNPDPEKPSDRFYEIDLSSEFWAEDPSVLSRSTEVENLLKSLEAHDRRDAYRAWRGSKLRTELYAADQDGTFQTALSKRPFTVTEAQFGVRQEVSSTTFVTLSGVEMRQKAVFFSFSEGSRSTNWERGSEPKTSFSFTADYDAYGQAQKQISIAVPRGKDPLSGNNLTGATKTHEGGYLCTYAESIFIHKDETDTYICDRQSEQKSYEVSNNGSMSVFALRDEILNDNATLKVIGHVLNYYDGNAFQGASLGTIENYGALSRSESLYSTKSDIDLAYTNTPELFKTATTPNWDDYPEDFILSWPNNRAAYDYHVAPPYENGFYKTVQRQQYDFQEAGINSYGIVTAMQDAYGIQAEVEFDAYSFLPEKVVNSLGMETSADYDYRILQAKLVTDANDNQTAFAFSPLGLLKATAVMGKAGDNEGDTLADPGTVMEYDFHAFANAEQPILVKTIKRAFHVNDAADTGETYTSIEYSDGFGRLLQSRSQADDIIYKSAKNPNGDSGLPADQTAANANLVGTKKGDEDPDNVVVNGFKLYNNKGKVVEQFEPYFDTDYLFKPIHKVENREFIKSLGVAIEVFINQYSSSDLNNESLLSSFLESRLKLGYTTHEYIELLTKHHIISNTLEMDNAEKIEVPDASQWHFGTGDFSIEIRFRVDQNSNALVGNQTRHELQSSGFRMFLADRRIFFAIGDGVKNANLRQDYHMNVGEWYHIVGVKNSGDPNNWKIYKNGSLDAPLALQAYNLNVDCNGMPVGNLFIGERIETSHLDGSIRDVRIYNRALSAQEVADNYNAGAGNNPAIANGLVFNMPINEGSGTNIQDYSEYKEVGTLSGPNYQWKHHFNQDWREDLPEELQKIRLFYDALGRPTQTLNPDGTAELSVYGIPTTLDAPSLQNSGRFTTAHEPTPWESYAYDANDLGGDTHPTESSSYNTHWNTPESQEIDALGRTILTRQRLDNSSANDIVMQYEYDIQGRLLQVTDPLGRTNFEYKYPTAVTQSEDEVPPEVEALSIDHLDSGLKEQIFDARSQLIESIDAKQSRTLWAYEEMGMLKRMWMAAVGEEFRLSGFHRYGNTSQKVNNQVGRPTHYLDESGFYYHADYDFKGNLLRKEHRFIKDELLEGSSRFKVDWLTTHNSNNDTGEIIETNFGYDALNRMVVNALPEDVDGDHKKVFLTYSRSGALNKVTLDGGEYLSEIAYNAKGQRLFVAYGNGVMNRYTYDAVNFRLLRMKAEKYSMTEDSSSCTYAPQSGTNRQDLAYEYDLNGNILKKKNRTPDCGISGTTLGVDALDHDYTYDAISRLLSATGRESDTQGESYRWADAPVPGSPNAGNTQAYTREYQYDKVGNVDLVVQTGTNAFGREFDYTDNTLEEIQVGGTAVNFLYDENGNLTQSGESRFYEWNEKDQLSFFKVQAGETPSVYAHYLYDASGNRVKKIVWDQQGNKEVTVYVDGIFEYRLKQEDGEDKEQNIVHFMDDSARIAQVRIGTAFNDDLSDNIHYVLDDHLGSSTTRLNTSGGVIDRQEFYPFGDTSLRTYSKKRYQYVGKEKDSESGLIYYGARYYAAWTCRFISVDPLASRYQFYSPYVYAGNKPINKIDIDGMQEEGASTGQGSQGNSNNASNGQSSQNNTTGNIEMNGPPSPISYRESQEMLNSHIVKKGDTLSEIAEANNISLESLRNANPQTQNRKLDDQINVGEELTVPKKDSKRKDGEKSINKNNSYDVSVTDANGTRVTDMPFENREYISSIGVTGTASGGLLGVSIEFGLMFDSRPFKVRPYLTLEHAVGADLSGGLILNEFQSKPNESLDFDDIEGWGESQNYAIWFFDKTSGGNSEKAGLHPKNYSNKHDKYEQYGFGISVGVPAGYTRNKGYTFIAN